MKKIRYVVAVKDTTDRTIRAGKILATYRNLEDARRDHFDLARRAGKEVWQVGIFVDGKCLN